MLKHLDILWRRLEIKNKILYLLASLRMAVAVPLSTAPSAARRCLELHPSWKKLGKMYRRANFISPERFLNTMSDKEYVSRAEGKLAGAVREFSHGKSLRKGLREGEDFFRDKTVLDIGSSTGGFTEFALKCGARKVIAVEKGTRQMKAPLRYDKRVELHEKQDIFDFSSKEKIDTIVADVSFVSLTKVLAYAKMKLACRDTDFLVMLKPQFEARENQLVNGVVKNEKMRREIIKNFEWWLKNNKFIIVNKHDNEVVGKNGNRERFYFLKIGR